MSQIDTKNFKKLLDDVEGDTEVILERIDRAGAGYGMEGEVVAAICVLTKAVLTLGTIVLYK